MWLICWVAGAPLSAMDGVLVAVKDEIDCLPYQTTGKRNCQSRTTDAAATVISH